MSSDEEMPDQEESQNEDLQLAYVIMLEDYKIILDKRMTPQIKAAIDRALKDLTHTYNSNTKQNIDVKQVLKKVDNMKSKTENITDMKQTGNKRNKLNQWQQKFFDLWKGNENLVIKKVPGAVTACASKNVEFADEEIGNDKEFMVNLQKKLLLQQINTAVAQEKAARAVEKAAGAVEQFVEDYFARHQESF